MGGQVCCAQKARQADVDIEVGAYFDDKVEEPGEDPKVLLVASDDRSGVFMSGPAQDTDDESTVESSDMTATGVEEAEPRSWLTCGGRGHALLGEDSEGVPMHANLGDDHECLADWSESRVSDSFYVGAHSLKKADGGIASTSKMPEEHSRLVSTRTDTENTPQDRLAAMRHALSPEIGPAAVMRA
mmetsp:Transcript_55436/g.154464  ORF Transcript_55436/g.154464 Transcript_55436/m.154464 type:complete len:186 (-) Transcript_55436:121-678(-)